MVKIDRRFGTLPKHLVTLMAPGKVSTYTHAAQALQHEIDPIYDTVCRITGMSPNNLWDGDLSGNRSEMRPCPPADLLDLHLAIRYRRRPNEHNRVDFDGGGWVITPATGSGWLPSPPTPPRIRWSGVLAKYSL